MYVERLRVWQRIKNLVGPATLDAVWTRHIADCAQLPALVPKARRWVDLGSGAGFPGLVIAIMLAETAGAHVDLIESNNRKCAFLREVVRETKSPATVHAGRIEDVLPRLATPVEVVTARALAPLELLVGLAEPLLARGAVGLFFTGETQGAVAGDPSTEPTVGSLSGYEVTTHASKTHDGGRVVMVRRGGSWDSRAEGISRGEVGLNVQRS